MSDFVEFAQFLSIPIFDYIIGNSDRRQSNWGVINKGNDRLRWRSLVETKSKSLIRRTVKEEKLPTHLEMMKYIKEKYFDVTEDLVKKIISVRRQRIFVIYLICMLNMSLVRIKKVLLNNFY